MLPATKLCRAKIEEFNEHFKGVVVALRPGDFYDVTVRYEILEFKRWVPRISETDYCTVVMKCLTNAEPPIHFLKSAVEGEIEEHGFKLTAIEDLLRDGVLTVHSHIHTEEWFRPDQMCMAV